MNCEGCDHPLPEGAQRCPDCNRPVGGRAQAPSRSAPTVVYRPEELGLPGSVPSYGPTPAAPTGPATPHGGLPPGGQYPAGPPHRSGGRGWVWALAGLLVLALVAAGSWVVLRDDDPDDVALETASPSEVPSGGLAAEAPTPAVGVLATTAPSPPGDASSPPVDAPSAPAATLPPVVEVQDGFLVFASDDREPLQAPVLQAPSVAWTRDLDGPVSEVRGDADLVVATEVTPSGVVVRALDTNDGTQRWIQPVTGDITSTSLTVAEVVILTVDHADRDLHEVFGLDPATGQTRWRQEVSSDGGLVVLQLGGGRLVLSGPGLLAHLEPTTGAIVPILEGADVRLGQGIAATLDDGVVRVVDQADAAPLYDVAVNTADRTALEYVFSRDRVVVYDGQQIWSTDSVGQREWDHTLVDPAHELTDIVLLPDGRVLVTTVGEDGTFALDAATGELAWRSPSLVDTVGQFEGQLRGLDSATGQVEVADLADGTRVGGFADEAIAGAAYADGVYYAVNGGQLQGMGLIHCDILWSVPVEGITDRWAVDGGIVAVSGTGIALLR